MEGGIIAVLFIVVLVIGIGMWSLSMSMDKNRITDYIHRRGGRIASISWAPFGKGWFGEKNDRIYEVVYYDQAGNQHFATCKTNFWSGVYWTEDRITHRKSGWYDSVAPSHEPGRPLIRQITPDEGEADERRRLRAENARLREELARQTAREEPAETDKCPACGAAIKPEHARCPDCQIVLR